MNWKELKEHCNNWKQGKVVKRQKYVPTWKRIKNYQASLLNMEKLAGNIDSDDRAMVEAMKELNQGNKISVMG